MKAKVLNPLSHDGKDYTVGDTFDGSKELVNELIEAGALRDPATVEKEEVDTSAADAARAEAEAILDTANREAAAVLAASDKVLADAQEEAKTAVSAAKGQAEKIVAEAKAEAVKITKTAEEAAKAAKEAADKK